MYLRMIAVGQTAPEGWPWRAASSDFGAQSDLSAASTAAGEPQWTPEQAGLHLGPPITSTARALREAFPALEMSIQPTLTMQAKRADEWRRVDRRRLACIK